MEKKDIIAQKIEGYIDGKDNPRSFYYSKFNRALVSLNDIEQDEDIEFLKNTIDSELSDTDYISYEDLELYDELVNYFASKTEDKPYVRTI